VPLIIMDEPTNTLDPIMRDELLGQLKQARRRGQAVLFSSHVLSEVEQICDRVVMLRAGQIVHVQDMAELRRVMNIDIHFTGAVPEPPALEGVRVRRRQGERLTLVFHGELRPLLAWLARQAVAELHIEPLGLLEIYQRFHGTAS
jgi:ABC-2 type transport system ATP-binding protein